MAFVSQRLTRMLKEECRKRKDVEDQKEEDRMKEDYVGEGKVFKEDEVEAVTYPYREQAEEKCRMQGVGEGRQEEDAEGQHEGEVDAVIGCFQETHLERKEAAQDAGCLLKSGWRSSWSGTALPSPPSMTHVTGSFRKRPFLFECRNRSRPLESLGFCWLI